MKISVKLEVSETRGSKTFTLEDLGVTLEEWRELSDKEKANLVETAVFDLSEQPYWCVTSFEGK